MPNADAVVLPVSVRPTRYRIHLQPDLARASFKGSEDVYSQVDEPTSTIVLNAVEWDLHSAEVFRDGLPSLEAEISFDQKAETVTLEFGEAISAGPARLEIDFTI